MTFLRIVIRSIFLFEHDLRANASRLSRGKTGTHPSGRGPRACFSGSCSRAALSLLRHSGRSATRADPESRSGVGNRFREIAGSRVSRAPRNDGGSRIDVHEIPQQRVDFVVPALAAEHAVMADAGLHV